MQIHVSHCPVSQLVGLSASTSIVPKRLDSSSSPTKAGAPSPTSSTDTFRHAQSLNALAKVIASFVSAPSPSIGPQPHGLALRLETITFNLTQTSPEVHAAMYRCLSRSGHVTFTLT